MILLDEKNPRGLNSLPHWTKFLWSLDQIENPQPCFYEIDLTNRCRRSCPWCISKHGANGEKLVGSPTDMSMSLFLKIVDEAADKRRGITLTGGGEPTLHYHFKTIVDILTKYVQEKRIPQLGLVSSGDPNQEGISWDHLDYYLSKTTDPPAWVRISVNYWKPEPRLIALINKYPGRIGISLIYGDDIQLRLCTENKTFFESLPVKFIRGPKRAHQFDKPTIQPIDCVGRKFHKVFETDGNIPYCCLARGYGHEMPEICPLGCPWNIDFKSLWGANPFS